MNYIEFGNELLNKYWGGETPINIEKMASRMDVLLRKDDQKKIGEKSAIAFFDEYNNKVIELSNDLTSNETRKVVSVMLVMFCLGKVDNNFSYTVNSEIDLDIDRISNQIILPISTFNVLHLGRDVSVEKIAECVGVDEVVARMVESVSKSY